MTKNKQHDAKMSLRCVSYLLQVDLQSSRKENERLSAELQKLQSVTQNMDEVRRENQELSRRLETQQETRQDTSGPDDDDLKVRTGYRGNQPMNEGAGGGNHVSTASTGEVSDSGPTAAGHSGEAGG